MPGLSIVTAVLNDPQGLEASLESLKLIKELMRDSLELIVVDSSPLIHSSLREKYSSLNIKWLDSKPEGVYAALNIGNAIALQDYIWHLHAGDIATSCENLLRSLEELSKTGAMLSLNAVEIHKERAGESFLVEPGEMLRADLLNFKPALHQGCIFRRDVFKKLNGFDTKYRFAADVELLARSLKEGMLSIRSQRLVCSMNQTGLSNRFALDCIREVRIALRALKLKLNEFILVEAWFHFHSTRIRWASKFLERLGLLGPLRRVLFKIMNRRMSN